LVPPKEYVWIKGEWLGANSQETTGTKKAGFSDDADWRLLAQTV